MQYTNVGSWRYDLSTHVYLWRKFYKNFLKKGGAICTIDIWTKTDISVSSWHTCSKKISVPTFNELRLQRFLTRRNAPWVKRESIQFVPNENNHSCNTPFVLLCSSRLLIASTSYIYSQVLGRLNTVLTGFKTGFIHDNVTHFLMTKLWDKFVLRM